MKKKIRVAVLYGGRSGEHEISVLSAASVIRNLDRSKYEVIPIGIDKEGRWLLNDVSLIENLSLKNLPVVKAHEAKSELYLAPRAVGGEASGDLINVSDPKNSTSVDVFFPVLHGPMGEDGTVQGLFELANVPYVGAGVLGSAVGMDKDVAKRLVAGSGLSVGSYFTLKTFNDETLDLIDTELGLPVFIKPTNMGSSVGISKVSKKSDLRKAIELAFRYDKKVMVEQALDIREIELSVLENPVWGDPPLVSVPGEIVPKGHEFYSYESKYTDEGGATLEIPAKLSKEVTEEVRQAAAKIFVALECRGLARVDLFIDKLSGEIIFNEINTMPGFTSISMYPKLWEASGLSYSELLDRLIDLALTR